MLVNLLHVTFVSITVRARPGSSRTAVGGTFGQPPQLVVRVTAPAVDGRANTAVRQALSAALSVPLADVEITHGDTSRTKIIRVHGDVDRIRSQIEVLLNPASATTDLFDD